ncbi:MAG: hypothetical protein QW816_02135 [Desulfurococcaceae archaeon]
MDNGSLWLSMILDRVRSDLEGLCSELGVLKECNLVLESLVESHPVWFEGKKKRTIVAVVLYVSLLISRGPRRGVLKEILDLVGVSKVSMRDAVSRLINVDWDLGLVYLNPRFYSALRKRISLPGYVVPLMLSEVIRARLSRISPGLYEFLDLQCKKTTGRDCVAVLLEDPAVIRDIIVSKYGSLVVAKRVAERFFAPIVDALGIEKTPRELAELLVSDPGELRKLIISHVPRSR